MMTQELKQLVAATRAKYERVADAAQDGVYLYGAGFIGRWAVGYLEELGIPVHGFIDSDERKRGQIIAGKQVYSLADIPPEHVRTILISSRHAVLPIEARLASLVANVMSIDAFVVHRAYPSAAEPIENLLAHDTRSLQTFHAVLMSMLQGTTRPLAPFADNRPFFDRFGFFNSNGEVFVDAGAYVGDSLERFIWSVNGVFREIHAFEPGGVQFRALAKRVDRLTEEWALKPDAIHLVNKALSSDSRSLSIIDEANLTQMALVSHDQYQPINTLHEVAGTSLDAYFQGKRYSLLKVDVEGSERDLLDGGRSSIAEHRPRIALSVYHFPTDIFELPALVKCMNGDYEFQLGHHSSALMETVLYCRDKND